MIDPSQFSFLKDEILAQLSLTLELEEPTSLAL
jgi:hypothetical protein